MSQDSSLNINQSSGHSPTNQPPIANDEIELRRKAREERRAMRRQNGPWIGGLVLIILGVVFLLQNIGIFYLQNWWALFILIPAVASFSTAYFMYRSNGNHLSHAVRGSLLGGIALVILACIFLFNIDLGVWWPVLLIVAGVALLLNFILPE